MMKRILLVARWPVGGIRTYFRYVYRLFEGDDVEFTLIAPKSSETAHIADDIGSPLANFIECGSSSLQFITAVRTACREYEYSIVHSHGLGASIYSTIALLGRSEPHIVTLHDVFFSSHFRGISGFLKRALVNWALERTKHLHLLGDDARDNFVAHFSAVAEKLRNRMTIIKTGIELSRFEGVSSGSSSVRKDLNIDQDRRMLGFFGRFMAQKGFSLLVDAIHELAQKKNGASMPAIICVGSGGYLNRERRKLADLGIEKHFLFLPFTPNPAEVMVQMDGIIMPSRWEAFPLIPMEVLVLGVPLLASNCIGLREIIRETPAFVFETDDSVALRIAIEKWLDDPRKQEFEAFSSKASERFDVRSTKDKLAQLYSEVSN